MKTIGMIGGMSWESTLSYYQLLNQGIKQELGGLHSAKVNLVSVDFAEIERLQHQGDWLALAASMQQAARSVQASGADFLLIATNTMHKVAAEVEQVIDIPLLHIGDATAQALLEDGICKVGLLGTRFTMEQDFYKQRLQQQGLAVVIPDSQGREQIHRIIYEELCQGQINDSSKQYYLSQIERLKQAGAEAIILGCTEIGLLLKQTDSDLPLYDTTVIHVAAAVAKSLRA
ncbi:aspartate/glutamate racemase family protein [Agarivorans sp.]|uniref:aspartate/glutamate racemase family protein n=1 Tax=Agarivorans sp. TaxID=1872412 RepID=UPI003D06D9CA